MPATRIFDALRKKVIAAKGVIPAEQRAMYLIQHYSRELESWQQKYKNRRFSTLVTDSFTKQLVAPTNAQPGFFYFYNYDAKTKDTLPYWDKFPFILCLNSAPGRFWGLNFHYLDYYQRARLFDMLYPFREGRVSHHTAKNTQDPHGIRDIRMRLRVSYLLLKSATRYAAFKPCFKQYLTTHVRTPLIKVGASEWEIALMLPVHQFQKKTAQYVWSKSRSMF